MYTNNNEEQPSSELTTHRPKYFTNIKQLIPKQSMVVPEKQVLLQHIIQSETSKYNKTNTGRHQSKFAQSNMFSSLKNDIHQLQTKMAKLNLEEQQKTLMYAKPQQKINEETNMSPPYSTHRPQIVMNQNQYLTPFLNLKHSSKPQSNLINEYQQKIRILSTQIRNKDCIISELQRRLQTLKQNYQTQITSVLKQKLESQKALSTYIQKTSSSNKILPQSFLNEQLNMTKQKLNRLKKQLEHHKKQKLDFLQIHNQKIHSLEQQIYSLKVLITGLNSDISKQQDKILILEQSILNKNEIIRKIQDENSQMYEYLMKEVRVCPKCKDHEENQNKLLLLSEQNDQLRKSYQSFIDKFTFESKVLNPQLEMEKKNLQIEEMAHKIKHIDSLVSQINSLDRKCKVLECVLQLNNQQIMSLRLKSLNATVCSHS